MVFEHNSDNPNSMQGEIDPTDPCCSDVVLNLNGKQVVIPGHLDPVRLTLWGDDTLPLRFDYDALGLGARAQKGAMNGVRQVAGSGEVADEVAVKSYENDNDVNEVAEVADNSRVCRDTPSTPRTAPLPVPTSANYSPPQFS